VKSFSRLIRMLTPFRLWIAMAVLLSFATVGSSIGLMAVSAYLISKAAVVTEVVELSLLVTWVRVFAISRATLRYAERVVTHTATFRILTRLRVWFFTGIEPLAPAGLQGYRSGDLLARIGSDIETLETFYVRVVVPPLAAALVTIFASLLLAAFDIWLGIALLFFLLLNGVVLPLATRWLSLQPAAQLVSIRAKLHAVTVDEIQGIADLLAFTHEDRHLQRAMGLSQQLYRLQERMAVVRGMSNALTVFLTGLAGLVILWLAIPLVTAGQIQGVYLALLPLAAIASFEAVQPLSQALQTLESSQVAALRLFELIDAPPAVTDPGHVSPHPADYTLELRDLCFSYTPDGPLVLNKVSLNLPTGSRTAIVGPSGAGKSTLVNVLLRFWDYEAGEIFLGGHELREYQAEDVRRILSVVSQQTHLFNGTIRDNLWLADPDASEEQIIKVCQQAQLHDFILTLPFGYETVIGENGLLLSGGERQRLAIARALLKNAPVLILDEATANLDALTERQILQVLELFMTGRTTLIISHRRAALELAERIFYLEDGRIYA